MSDRRSFLFDSLLVATGLGPVLVGCRRGGAPDRVVSGVTTKAEAERADADLLVKAARLEESAIKVYRAAAGLPFIKADARVLGTAGRFLGQHQQHRDALVKVARQLGRAGVDPSGAAMPPLHPDILDAKLPEAKRKVAVLRFARSLEMKAAQAYFAFVTRNLQTEFARRTAAEIMPVEAQHVAVYDLLLGERPPAPTAFFSEQV